MAALRGDLESESFEDSFCGFDIFVEPNPDSWRGGFQWNVCRDNEELECGLEFSGSLALDVARRCIEKITQGKSIPVASNN